MRAVDILPSCKFKSVSDNRMTSEPIKAQKNETNNVRSEALHKYCARLPSDQCGTTTYDWQPILPEIDAILFQERSEIFVKKTDIFANLVSIFNMNCSEFASVLNRTFSKVIPSGSNDDKRFSNWFSSCWSIYLYTQSNCISPQDHNKTYSTNSSRSNFVYKPMSHITTLGNRKSTNLFSGQISVLGGQITLFAKAYFTSSEKLNLIANAKWQKWVNNIHPYDLNSS